MDLIRVRGYCLLRSELLKWPVIRQHQSDLSAPATHLPHCLRVSLLLIEQGTQVSVHIRPVESVEVLL